MHILTLQAGQVKGSTLIVVYFLFFYLVFPWFPFTPNSQDTATT